MKTIVIFTQSYPFSRAGETSFLTPEVAALRRVFDRVVVIPREAPLGPPSGDLDGIQIDLSLARRLRLDPISLIEKGGRAVTSGPLYQELMEGRPYTLSARGLLRAFAFAGMASTTSAWALRFVRKLRRHDQPLVLYTYWMNFVTEGLSRLRRRGLIDVPLISRAHGWDLYSERREPPYIPFRSRTLRGLSKLCLVSEHGMSYVRSGRFGPLPTLELHRLGVPDSGVKTRPSHDGVWRLLSCSFANPVKRLPLLAEAVIALANQAPDRRIEWSHIGDGPELSRVRELCSNLPKNLGCHFTGTLTQAQVLGFYATHAVDLFVNVSENEGLPVSIMESQRSGVPVVATDVGGTREIVNDRVGRLIAPDSTATVIADAIRRMLADPNASLERRHESVENWRRHFQAEANYRKFAESVASLC